MGREIKPLRMLMVDSPANAGLVLHQMRNFAYDVTAERVDTQEALVAALAAGAWDIVISDQELPALSSSSVLQVHA